MTRRARKVRREEWTKKKVKIKEKRVELSRLATSLFDPTGKKKIKEKRVELSRLATSLFDPTGKNPYYLNRSSSGDSDMYSTLLGRIHII